MSDPNEQLRVYISGPITGHDDHNRPAFEEARALLTSVGFIPVVPFDVAPYAEGKSWRDYLREDLRALLECDAIYLLDGWERSPGALLESRVAHAFGLPQVVQAVGCDHDWVESHVEISGEPAVATFYSCCSKCGLQKWHERGTGSVLETH